MFLPAPAYFTADAAFHTVLGSTLRLLIASFIAYLVGSLINAKLMVYLKYKNEEKLFFRCIASTFAGEGMDAIIFRNNASICTSNYDCGTGIIQNSL